MKRLFTTLLPIGLSAAIAIAMVAPNAAFAFASRSPQVVFNGTSLQNYLNSVGESINVSTDQLDAQVWTTSVSGNATFTMMIELAGNAASNNIGVYNSNAGASPTLFQLFPGAASAGWYVTAHFAGGNLSVALFDNNGVYQGSNSYSGVNANGFGFYLQGPGGTFYSQDYRNAGSNAQILTYAGTGNNYGDWWECFEDLPYNSSGSDFEDCVLLLQSVVPTPTHNTSWGGVKNLYR
jgi:hypothetical protein